MARGRFAAATRTVGRIFVRLYQPSVLSAWPFCWRSPRAVSDFEWLVKQILSARPDVLADKGSLWRVDAELFLCNPFVDCDRG